jgi:hypothetical protein
MTKPNVNPYYDQQAAERAATERAVVVVPAAVGDSGMPGWMLIAAPFVGLALFGIAAFVGLRTGAETPPTQGQHQAATQPEKTKATQPDATAQQAQQQQNQQAAPARQTQPQTQAAPPPNPTATTGASPKPQ